MPIIAALLVSLAIEKYQERQAAKNVLTESHSQETGFETGITSPDIERRREEEAFHELQKYANFQKDLSSKVLDDLSRDDSPSTSRFSKFIANSNRSTGNQWYDPLSEARYITQGQLPGPIIISQRVPGSDGPGWLRSYSPALMSCDIPQKPFLKFLDDFNASFPSIPEVVAVNVAALESRVSWRDETTNLSTAIPDAVQLAKAAQREQRLGTCLDEANLSLFSPRGLFAMIITSAPDDSSPIVTINVLDAANSGTSPLRTHGPGESGQRIRSFSSTQPRPRHPNKLQKMSNLVSSHGNRIPLTRPSDHPLFSLISTISNSRESKKNSRRRRNQRFQRARPSSRASVTSSIEGAFGVTKVGNPPGSARGIMERMLRDDAEDTESERDGRNMQIQPGAIYLVIVNDPSDDIKITEHEDIYSEAMINIDPSLNKGKAVGGTWYEGDENRRGMPERDIGGQQFDENMGEGEDLPPRYSSIHPEHRAKVQAWREEHPDIVVPLI